MVVVVLYMKDLYYVNDLLNDLMIIRRLNVLYCLDAVLLGNVRGFAEGGVSGLGCCLYL